MTTGPDRASLKTVCTGWQDNIKLLLWELPETLVRLLDAVGMSWVAKIPVFSWSDARNQMGLSTRGRYTVYAKGLQRQGNFCLQYWAV